MIVLRHIWIVICLGIISEGHAGEVVVSPDGPISSIRAALTEAAPFDTVVVMPGRYRERGIAIDKPVTLLGVGNPVIDGQMQGEILTIVADHVNISGMVFRNVGTSYLEDHAAIRVRRVRDFQIWNNRVENSFFGIYLEKAHDGIVAGNIVAGRAEDEMSSGNAIHLWYCDNIVIEDNIVTGHRDGIYLEFANNSFVGCNISEGHLRYGLHFMFSNDNTYIHNTFEHNGAGVAVMFSRRIKMIENTFRENWGKAAYGLLLKEIYDGTITGNRFQKNTIAIFVEGSNRIKYENNGFTNNGWAVKMSGGCQDNVLTGNNFIANSFDLAVHSAMGNNVIHGNYWGDYSGYDLDRDGIGDVAHRPVKLFTWVVNKCPEAVILLRSMFIDLINYSERVSPIFTPAVVADNAPLMNANKIPL